MFYDNFIHVLGVRILFFDNFFLKYFLVFIFIWSAHVILWLKRIIIFYNKNNLFLIICNRVFENMTIGSYFLKNDI